MNFFKEFKDFKEDTKRYLNRIKKKEFKENESLVMPIGHKHETGEPST